MSLSLSRAVVAFATLSFITACGAPSSSERVFEKAGEDCSAEVVDKRFVVHFLDGRMQVVTAESERAFLDGFVTENLRQIRFAEPEYRLHNSDVHVQASSSPITTMDNWGVARIDADALWTQNTRGEGVIVAVIDTGVDITHPQLAGRIVVNTGEQGKDAKGRDKATNGIDDDGDGFIDNVYGYDFAYNRPLNADNAYHGTHVAGIIAAEHADTKAGPQTHVQGVAPAARLMPLAFLDADGQGLMSDGVRAIKYAVTHGARVINASWGGPVCSRSLREVITSLADHGVVFVNAAGNESLDVDRNKEYPASLNLLAQFTIGATAEFDGMAEYSNYGAKAVHVFAPGTNIVSTLPNAGYGRLSGTSMATPFMSGAIALLLGAEPQATTPQLRQAIYSTVARRSDYVNASQGRVDLSVTLAELRRIMAL